MVDFISSLPDSVISQEILRRLELRDALRTSVLSRSWRYKWTLIPDLKIRVMFCGLLMDRKVNTPSEYLNTVNIILQQTKPPDSVELLFPPSEIPIRSVDTAIQFTLRKGVRALNMWDFRPTLDPLPSYLPLRLSLESLDFYKGRFCPPPAFAGFPNLKSLMLHSVQCNAITLSEFIISCTKLEKLVLQSLDYLDASRLSIRAPNLRYIEVKDTELPQFLEITSVVELNLCLIPPANHGKFVLPSCVVKLEHLMLGGSAIKYLLADGVSSEISSVLLGLKTLTAYKIDIHDMNVFSCLLSLIVSSPCLHRLNVYLSEDADVTEEADFGSELARYADYSFNDLTHVKICFVTKSSAELGLFELLLARSPVLEELSYNYNAANVSHDVCMAIYLVLMRFKKASSKAEIKYLYSRINHDKKFDSSRKRINHEKKFDSSRKRINHYKKFYSSRSLPQG